MHAFVISVVLIFHVVLIFPGKAGGIEVAQPPSPKSKIRGAEPPPPKIKKGGEQNPSINILGVYNWKPINNI